MKNTKKFLRYRRYQKELQYRTALVAFRLSFLKEAFIPSLERVH